jgi:hypothetical protein
MKWLVVLLFALGQSVRADSGVRHRKLNEDPTNPIPGQYIVEFYPEYDPMADAAGLLATFQETDSSSEQVEVLYFYDSVINGLALTNVPEDQLASFLDNPQVKQVWRVCISNRVTSITMDSELTFVTLLFTGWNSVRYRNPNQPFKLGS